MQVGSLILSNPEVALLAEGVDRNMIQNAPAPCLVPGRPPRGGRG